MMTMTLFKRKPKVQGRGGDRPAANDPDRQPRWHCRICGQMFKIEELEHMFVYRCLRGCSTIQRQKEGNTWGQRLDR